MKNTHTPYDQATCSAKRPLALVIDDNESVRTTESLLLRHVGFDVLTAADGSKGIKLFRAQRDRVDLVVTDYSMPSKNGGEVCRAVNRENPEIPVILVSGDVERIGDGLLDEFSAVIGKPFRAKHFLDKAKQLAAC